MAARGTPHSNGDAVRRSYSQRDHSETPPEPYSERHYTVQEIAELNQHGAEAFQKRAGRHPPGHALDDEATAAHHHPRSRVSDPAGTRPADGGEAMRPEKCEVSHGNLQARTYLLVSLLVEG